MSGNYSKLLHKRLVELIRNKRFSAAEMAKAGGVTRSMVYRYLDGETVPGIDFIGRLSGALGLSISQFLGETEVREIDHPIEECLRRISRSVTQGAGVLPRSEVLDEKEQDDPLVKILLERKLGGKPESKPAKAVKKSNHKK